MSIVSTSARLGTADDGIPCLAKMYNVVLSSNVFEEDVFNSYFILRWDLLSYKSLARWHRSDHGPLTGYDGFDDEQICTKRLLLQPFYRYWFHFSLSSWQYASLCWYCVTHDEVSSTTLHVVRSLGSHLYSKTLVISTYYDPWSSVILW